MDRKVESRSFWREALSLPHLLAIIFLATFFLPASWIAGILPVQSPEPFDTLTGLVLFSRASLTLVMAAVLLYLGLDFWKTGQQDKVVAGWTPSARRRYAVLAAATAFVLSALLLAKGLHSLYWLMIWDSTHDPLGDLWLPFPMLAVLVAGAFLVTALQGKLKVTGAIYFLLVMALLMAVVERARRADFRELTEERVAQTARALETYHARHGEYPQNLQQLTPWTIFSVRGPVIIFGQSWCYDGGGDAYRLGYVYREHWSDPHLIGHIYEAKGDVAAPHPICAKEITALREGR